MITIEILILMKRKRITCKYVELITSIYRAWLLLPNDSVDWLIFVIQFMYNSEGLQELIKVYTSIFVKVNASGKVIDCPVVNLDPQVCTKEMPGVSELFNRDQTWTQSTHYKLPSLKEIHLNSAARILDLPDWSLSIILKMISMSFLYLNRASAKLGVT